MEMNPLFIFYITQSAVGLNGLGLPLLGFMAELAPFLSFLPEKHALFV